ncbi:MAG: cytochrome P450, partial [Gammaproteobacteria bacterium]|nr:cytochrome P450 [Gammaproteobacteria bacterium]
LNWAWYLIAGHPEVEARLLAEANTCLADFDANDSDALSTMTYTQQVLEETLRLYPPVWLFTRRSTQDDELEDYDVPPGTDIYLSPYLLHRSAHIWPDPDSFDPDRFELTDAPKKDRPYFPFSLGPRRCLGEYFSFLEMKVHLGLLLPRFRMQRLDDDDPGLELAINLRSKNDIQLKPMIRQESHAAV